MEERVLLIRKPLDSSSAQSLILDKNSRASRAYMIKSDGTLDEVSRCKHYFSSWLWGQDLLSDGGLYFSSPVDPVFVLLPYLESSRKKSSESTDGGYFCSIDQILESSEAPQLKLLTKAAALCLPLVCDTKEACGDLFFRLNDDMVLAWLLVKLPMVQEALDGVLGGMDQDARVAYCLGFLGEYLSESWINKVAQHLKIDLAAIAGNTSVVGAPRSALACGIDGDSAHDKRPKVVVDPKAAARKKAEETKQANKAKLAQGTKDITSFFKPRT